MTHTNERQRSETQLLVKSKGGLPRVPPWPKVTKKGLALGTTSRYKKKKKRDGMCVFPMCFGRERRGGRARGEKAPDQSHSVVQFQYSTIAHMQVWWHSCSTDKFIRRRSDRVHVSS